MSPPPPPSPSTNPPTTSSLPTLPPHPSFTNLPYSLPTLSTSRTTSRATQTSALKLIADSIAQQRQLAARALLTHPLSLSVFVLLVALFWAVLGAVGWTGIGIGTGIGNEIGINAGIEKGKERGRAWGWGWTKVNINMDKTVVLTTAGGLVMVGLVGVRAYTAKYLERAEGVGWGWLFEGKKTGKGGGGEKKKKKKKLESREVEEEEKIDKVQHQNAEKPEDEDEDDEVEVVVLVTIWDEKVIATAVMDVDPPPPSPPPSSPSTSPRPQHQRQPQHQTHHQNAHDRERKATIRAWTTMLKYRGVGIGKGVLEEAVRVAVREYGCGKVEFAEGHANSMHILPAFLNAGFHRNEARARLLLGEILRRELIPAG